MQTTTASPQMRPDRALIESFRTDPNHGYAALLDRYTPVILRMIRKFLRDPDEVMETYTSICERLRANDFQALRRFRVGSELAPWLSVVVANACRDRFRKRRHVSSPKSVLKQLDERERLVFKYYYQEHVPKQEIADYIKGRKGMACDDFDVNQAIEKIDKLLSVNKRWHLIAALRANRPAMSLEDLASIGIRPRDDKDLPDVFHQERESRSEQLSRALGEMDPDDQLLVLLRFEHGMRARDISKIMQFDSHKYVYTRLRTIISRLRREMVGEEA